ncbi:TPA: hypothetical protein SLE56_001149 [Morganella morganii]|nr:hypothetical protein [Morganella morganii]
MIGYHGTDANNEASIMENNFNVSSEIDDWLGNGAYFFIAGLLDPMECAARWGKVNSYDSVKKIKKYDAYVVLEAELNVSADATFDLDVKDNIEAYEEYRQEYFRALELNGLRTKSMLENDCEICNMIFEDEDAEIEAIVRREYIKLDKLQRIRKHNSRIPNCRIVSIKNPENYVSNIRGVCGGRVAE